MLGAIVCHVSDFAQWHGKDLQFSSVLKKEVLVLNKRVVSIEHKQNHAKSLGVTLNSFFGFKTTRGTELEGTNVTKRPNSSRGAECCAPASRFRLQESRSFPAHWEGI